MAGQNDKGSPGLGARRLAAKPGTASYAAMDTNGDGVVSDLDDPYAPYYPSDAYVDWVGMSVRARTQVTGKAHQRSFMLCACCSVQRERRRAHLIAGPAAPRQEPAAGVGQV